MPEIDIDHNYYPFGLQHKGYNDIASSLGNDKAEQRKFGGKELQSELGLGWYDITARNYDPALGRWMNLDPLADQGRRWGPYSYSFNNPLYFQDPDGMWPNPFQGLGDNIAQGFRNQIGSVSKRVDNFVKSASSTLTNAQNNFRELVVENKNELLKTAQVVKTVGNSMEAGGMAIAAGGVVASATGVGAIPGAPTVGGGLALAGTGGDVSLVGDGIEIITNVIVGDLDSAENDVVSTVVPEVVGILIDKVIPGPNPDATPLVKDLAKVTNESVRMQAVENVEEVVERVVEN